MATEWSDVAWVVDKEKTQGHWLEIKDPNGWHRAVVKWDGCIHFQQFGNLPEDSDPTRKDEACCDGYIHICDLDDFIMRLQELKKLALAHFNQWPG